MNRWRDADGGLKPGQTGRLTVGHSHIHDIYMRFQIAYVYHHANKICRQQTHCIQHYEKARVRNFGKGESQHRKLMTRKLGGGET
jgi:hypothetical protein